MKNVITNKDPKQAAAIAYSVQRENNNKVRDSFTYRMFGTTGPKDVKGLTLEEAKKLLKNNRLLGYDGEILDESTGNLIKDELTEYQIVYKGKVLRTLYSLSEARYVKSSYIKMGMYVEIIETNTGRRIDCMKKFKVHYDCRSFIVNAKDHQDAATKVINKVKDDGKLVSKYIKKLPDGRPVPSAIVEHPNGYTFISAIVKEDRDFINLYLAEEYAKRLGYVKTNDSAIKDMRTVLASKLKKGDVILDNKNKPYKITSIDYEDGYVSLYADNLTEIGNARFTFDNNEKVTLRDSEIKDESDLQLLRNYFSENQPNKKMELRTKLKSMGYEEGVSGVNSRELMWVKLNGKKYEVKNLKNVTPLDSAIKDESNEEKYKKELAYWQDLYMNRKLITSSELSKKAAELRKKYNIKDKAFRVTHKDKTFTVVAKDKKDAALKIAKHISK